MKVSIVGAAGSVGAAGRILCCRIRIGGRDRHDRCALEFCEAACHGYQHRGISARCQRQRRGLQDLAGSDIVLMRQECPRGSLLTAWKCFPEYFRWSETSLFRSSDTVLQPS